MPITLAQAKVGMANHVDQQVIDQFRRGSMLLEALTFDNSVSPGTGGSTLTYGYTQLKTPAGADFRDINTDYTDTVADRETKSVDLKIFGGTFKIDRVLANTANGQISEVQFQLEEHIKATTNLFHYTAINGDKGSKGFDGLDTLLVGTSTELNADASKAIDLSTSAAIDTNYKTVLDMLDEFLSELDGVPTMLIGNAALLTKIRSCARRAGYLTHSEDAFGRQMSGYNGIPFMDMQYYYDTAEKKGKAGRDDHVARIRRVLVQDHRYRSDRPVRCPSGSGRFPRRISDGRQGDLDHAAGFLYRRPGQGR